MKVRLQGMFILFLVCLDSVTSPGTDPKPLEVRLKCLLFLWKLQAPFQWRQWVFESVCFPNDRNFPSDTLISSLYNQTCLSLTHLYLCSTYRFGFFFFALRNNMLLDTFPGGKWTPTYTQSYSADLYLVEFIILSMLLWTLCMGCSSNPKIVKNFFLSHIVFYLLWLWKQKKRINAIMQVD